LAGGLNLYGFANGDPVNFSDPFGLCSKEEEDCEDEAPHTDTVFVGCRRLEGGMGMVGNHCGVRIGENGSYNSGELLKKKGANHIAPLG